MKRLLLLLPLTALATTSAFAKTPGQTKPDFSQPLKTIADFHAACLEQAYAYRVEKYPDDFMVRLNKTFAWKSCNGTWRDQRR